jgi:hypothetical protein
MSKSKKLTHKILKSIIAEEKDKLLETLELKAKKPEDAAKKTLVVDADQYANSLKKCIDYYKACKLKEEKAIKDLKKLQEVKEELKRRILKAL